MKKRSIIIVVAVILVILAAVPLGLWGAYRYFNAPPRDMPEETIYSVEPGSSLYYIAADLENLHVIKKGDFLKILSKINKNDAEYKAGNYVINSGLSATEVMDLLISGRQKLESFTIPEGKTIRQVALVVSDGDFCGFDEFIDAAYDTEFLASIGIPGDSAEGYLFPDTYSLTKGYNAKQIIQMMAENFFMKLEEVFPEWEALTPEELRKKVIMASLIEKEYQHPDDAPLIASVINNRLKSETFLPKNRLQFCSTVIYIITELQEKPHPGGITIEDTWIYSDYNTYQNPGLPPGPIASPGKVALNGAFYPADTDYYFFVVDPANPGKHVFSTNLSDHNVARQEYIQAKPEN